MIAGKITGFFALLIMAAGCLMTGCHSFQSEENIRRCDSLCDLSYSQIYKNRDSAWYYADRALNYAAGNASSRSQVLNQLAFIRFMQMDFVGSRSLYLEAYSLSNNILYQLVSETGLMRICQQTSENADFYMYRNSAQRHINRIQEEIDDLDDHEQHIFRLAVQDFHTISAIYFLNLQQQKRAASEIAAFTPDENLMKADTAQWLSINYLKNSLRFVTGNTSNEKGLNSFDALMHGLRISRTGGYDYFTSRYYQGLAVLLNRQGVLDSLNSSRKLGVQILNDRELPLHSLPEYLARQSLLFAEKYGNSYSESVSWRILAGCYFNQGRYKEALTALSQALLKVNTHYRTHYRAIPTPHLLEPFNPSDSVSVEKLWMSNPHVLTVPDWIARIREQLSMVYSALGDKVRSDYNRNIYLDILEITRQDKETEIRYKELEHESRQLNILLGLVILGIVSGSFILYYYSRKWEHSRCRRISQLRKTLEAGRYLTSSMPEDVTDKDELFQCLSQALENKAGSLFGPVNIVRKEPEDTIILEIHRKLSKDEKMMADVLNCFITWTYAQGRNFVLLGDKITSIQEEKEVLHRKIFNCKKDNEVRRACVSLVNNVTPFIDRMLYELLKLKEEKTEGLSSSRHERYVYICELSDKINEYNELLTAWIQIRQGTFSFHIGSFLLQSLFTIIAERRSMFERSGRKLVISPTTSIIKADKLLTLFMLNTLVENAFKYTSPGGLVTVSSKDGNGFTEISIQDNGIGLSAGDCERILHSKVYDSSVIGMETARDKEDLKRKKGFGFGLMNCKGIIEKYRKSGPLFSVCTFGVESTPGKGSRFFFRLPKGVLRLLIPVMLLLSVQGLMSCTQSDQPSSTIVWKPEDPLLHKASAFADSVYYQNIDGKYARALQFADSARGCLNAWYLTQNPGGKELMKAYGSGTPAEFTWFSRGFNTDYHVILDIRNESAVAALALHRWNLYKYNNSAYTSLFKILGEDHRLSDYCRRMQRSSNNKLVLITVFLLVALAFAIAYYILYFRRRTLFLINLKQVLIVNRNLLDYASSSSKPSMDEILEQLKKDIDEIVPVQKLAFVVLSEGQDEPACFFAGDKRNSPGIRQYLDQACQSETFRWITSMELVAPLIVEWGSSRQTIGAWYIRFERGDSPDFIELLATLMTRSLANYLFHSRIRPERREREMELAEDDNKRLSGELSRLYIQNQVLDNCLSTIKHETMFYPSRIRQLAVSVSNAEPEKEKKLVDDMYELAAYYKKIYTLLSLNADRQLARRVFKATSVNVAMLLAHAEADYRTMQKKHAAPLPLSVNAGMMTPIVAKGDVLLLQFLFRNLFQALLSHPEEGRLTLSVRKEEHFVRFELADSRTFFDKCDLRMLFSPEGCRLQTADQVSVGTEYLICKQIIRDHAEYTVSRGCRINAGHLPEGGYVIWFTIPGTEFNG